MLFLNPFDVSSTCVFERSADFLLFTDFRFGFTRSTLRCFLGKAVEGLVGFLPSFSIRLTSGLSMYSSRIFLKMRRSLMALRMEGFMSFKPSWSGLIVLFFLGFFASGMLISICPFPS